MLPVQLTLLRQGYPAPTDREAAVLQDTLWAHAAPETGLEHVRVRAVPGGIGLVVYVRAGDPAAAQGQVRRLLANVLASRSPSVHGYCLALPG